MKQIITLIAFVICFTAVAQPGKGKMREKIKAEKIAFITEQLSLTETEAQAFWPIYNKHESATNSIKKQYLRPIKQKMRNNADVSDADANKMLGDLIIAENKMHEAKITLVNDLKSAIPAKKIIKLKAVEDAFNRKLLDRLRKFRENRRRD